MMAPFLSRTESTQHTSSSMVQSPPTTSGIWPSRTIPSILRIARKPSGNVV